MSRRVRKARRRGNNEGTIYQRPDGLWCAQVTTGYDAHGRQRRKTVYGHTREEVADKLLDLQQKAKIGGLDAPTMSLGIYLDYWLDTAVKVKVRGTTYDRYKQHVENHIKPHLGRVPLDKLSAFQVAQWYRDMTARGVSVWEQHKSGKCLRQALGHAIRFGLVVTNPAKNVPTPRPVSKTIRPLTLPQAKLFLRAAEADRLYAMYALALDSGMRQGELWALARTDLDLEAGEVSVTKSLVERSGRLEVREVKTKARRRRIRLMHSTIQTLRDHLRRMEEAGLADRPVFCDTEGGYLRKSNMHRRSFKPTLKRANAMAAAEGLAEQLPDIRFHDLRHTMATLLLLAGVNVKVVSERLGHAKIQITLDTYAHVLPTMQAEAVAKLEDLYKGGQHEGGV